MSEELDRQCAMALGWHTLPGCDALHQGDECIHDQIPNFSTGCRAARTLEDEIEQRGLQAKYSDALYKIAYGDVSNDESNDMLDLWLVIRATPEQRARAFIAAVEHTP